MKQRMLVGLGLIAVGLGVVAGSGRRHSRERHFFTGPLLEEPLIREPLFSGPLFGGASVLGQGSKVELDAVPLLVLRGAFNQVTVVAGDGPRIVVTVPDGGDFMPAAFTRKVEAAEPRATVVDLVPRRRVEVQAPLGTALRLKFAKSRIDVTGLDDVDVHSAKGRITLRNVAGTLRINSAADSVDVELSHERETRSVDATMAKSGFALTVPASRGGDYRISVANSSVAAPPSVEGGIPITVRGARSKIAIGEA
jgi:hypothetical protein